MVVAAEKLERSIEPSCLFVQFTKRDVILYAIGIGCCSDAPQVSVEDDTAENCELKYVYENHPEFQPFPTFLLSLPFRSELISNIDMYSAAPKSRLGFGIRPFPPESFGDGKDSGIIPRALFKNQKYIEEARKLPVLHIRQKFAMHNPLRLNPTNCDDLPMNIWLESKVITVDPRNVGTFVTTETKYYSKENQRTVCLATAEMTALVLGLDPDLVHAFGRTMKRVGNKRIDNVTSSSKTTKIHSYQIPRNAAIVYRLTGDYNPIHIEAKGNYLLNAKVAGSKRPVLHGLCTLGYAVRALLNRAEQFRSINPSVLSVECNFIKPVFVGDSIFVVVSDEPNASLNSKNLLQLDFQVYRITKQYSQPQMKSHFDGDHELVVDQGAALISLNERIRGFNKMEVDAPTMVSRL